MKTLILFTLTFILFPQNLHAEAKSLEEFSTFLQENNLKTPKNNKTYKKELLSYYKKNNFQPIWFDENGRELKNIESIKQDVAKHAYINGLEAKDYNFDIALSEQGFEREWLLTNSLLHYLNDTQNGRIDPEKYDTLIMALPEKNDLDKTLTEALGSRNLFKFLETISPQQVEYKHLKEKLATYRELEDKDHDLNIKGSAVVYPGEANKIIPQIRKRLNSSFKEYDGKSPKGIWVDKSQIKGEKLSDVIANRDQVKDEKDLALQETNPELLYGPALARRIAEFQYFHGLKADGVIGPNTIQALNTPTSKRIEQIKLSMERWRWLPSDLGKKHIRVNIAGYYARAVKNGKDEFVMPIIVGKVAHQTPVFSSVIKNVKIHPDWTSPDSISKRYVIPKIKRNPSVIDRLGYEIIDKNTWQVIPWSSVNIASLNSASTKNYMFRQKPGNKNALGLARFSIANDYSIFMHGTPNQSLFGEDDRNYSSGCIRLEDPFKMAYFLLKDEGMSEKKLSDLYYLQDNEFPDTTIVDLKKDIPVHLMYMTAWVDQNGLIHFNKDVYGRDKDLSRALDKLS